MDKELTGFIHDKQINSFPKLRFLLFLRQHPHLSGGFQQLAERMYVEATLVERIVNELQLVGLLKQDKNGYSLSDEPGLKIYLEDLAHTFDAPLARQELLKQVSRIA